MITLNAFAKVNLYLKVGKKRQDGYHEIETLMTRIGLEDTISMEATPSPLTEVLLRVYGDDNVPTGDDNLVVRAIRETLAYLHTTASVHVSLTKKIPVMAGLGGGSSDAAEAIRGINLLMNNPLSIGEMETIASRIGSDVPFFINGRPAFCTGRGEKTQALSLTLPPYAVVVRGQEPVSTPRAFALLDQFGSSDPPAFPVLSQYRFSDKNVYNSFESIVPVLCPSSSFSLSLLREYGGIGTLCGSGSSVFALFDQMSPAKSAADALRSRGYETFLCRSSSEESF